MRQAWAETGHWESSRVSGHCKEGWCPQPTWVKGGGRGRGWIGVTLSTHPPVELKGSPAVQLSSACFPPQYHSMGVVAQIVADWLIERPKLGPGTCAGPLTPTRLLSCAPWLCSRCWFQRLPGFFSALQPAPFSACTPDLPDTSSLSHPPTLPLPSLCPAQHLVRAGTPGKSSAPAQCLQAEPRTWTGTQAASSGVS